LQEYPTASRTRKPAARLDDFTPTLMLIAYLHSGPALVYTREIETEKGMVCVWFLSKQCQIADTPHC